MHQVFGIWTNAFDETACTPKTSIMTKTKEIHKKGLQAKNIQWGCSSIVLSIHVCTVIKKNLTNIESIYHAKAPFMPVTWHGETAIEVTDMCGPNPLKYHPGAVAAWEEAGYTLPDCAK